MPALIRVLIAVLLASMPGWSRANETIVLATGEWHPYISRQAPHFGVISHIVSDAFALEGVTVSYAFQSWARAYSDADRGMVQGAIIWRADAERARHFHYSGPVFESSTVLFHLKANSFEWAKLEDLQKITVGGTVGYKYQFEPNAAIHIDRAATDEIGFRKLLGGRFPVFISDIDAGNAVLNEHFSDEQRQRVIYHPRPVQVTVYHLILPRALPHSVELMERFNRGMQRLRDSGRYVEYFAALRRGDYAEP